MAGTELAIVFQDALTALNPLYTVGTQLAEPFRIHHNLSAKEAKRKAVDLMARVGIPQPESRLNSYPHQFSGGMRQRLLIAMAVALNPSVLIADEPTTALDVTVQAQIMALLRDLRTEYDMAVVLITHDLALVAEEADRVAVMYAGNIVETGLVAEVFANPQAPLHQGPAELGARQRPPRRRPQVHRRLAARPARHPRRLRLPGPLPAGPRDLRDQAADARHRQAPAASPPATSRKRYRMSENLLEVRDLRKSFHVPNAGKKKLPALDGITLDLKRGETLGLVGESGCGKSTLARTLLMLERPDEGTVRFDGIDPFSLRGKELLDFRRRVQMVFQDPYASLNSRMSAGDIIAEPWRTHKGMHKSRKDRDMQVRGLLDLVGLGAKAADKYPQEFSGGQRQRIGIARALALEPDVIICDEPVSALDLSVQAQVLNLLNDLQEQLGISYIFISHDLSVVRHVADRVSVMYLGRIIENGPTEAVFDRPNHPYTAALMSAAPKLDSAQRGERILLKGEVPSPIDPPSGCRFRTRCWKATEICATTAPPSAGDPAVDGHSAECHHPLLSEGSLLAMA